MTKGFSDLQILLPFVQMHPTLQGNSDRILKGLSRFVVFALFSGEEGVEPHRLLCPVYCPLDEHPLHQTFSQCVSILYVTCSTAIKG